MKMFHILFINIALLYSSTSHASNVNDFCVADLKGPDSPSGYHCKPPTTVTSDDFFYHLNPANTSSGFKSGASTAFVRDFPAVNGLGISALRADIAKGGVVPMHTHPGGNEILIMLEGEITVGFISAPSAFPPSVLYQKTLKPGDLFVIPQGHMHFEVNIGKGNASFYAVFSSADPRVHITDVLLFGNDLASDKIVRTTLLELAQVKKLKPVFGGTG